jgi:hypothetical protein
MSRSLLTRSISSVSLYEVGSQHQPLLTNLQDRLSLETMLLALQHIMEDLIIQALMLYFDLTSIDSWQNIIIIRKVKTCRNINIAFFTNHWGLLLWLFQMSYQCSSQVDYDVDPHLLLLIRKRVLQRLPSLSSFDFGRYEEV